MQKCFLLRLKKPRPTASIYVTLTSSLLTPQKYYIYIMVTNRHSSPGKHRDSNDLPRDLNELLRPHREKGARARREPRASQSQAHLPEVLPHVIAEPRCGAARPVYGPIGSWQTNPFGGMCTWVSPQCDAMQRCYLPCSLEWILPGSNFPTSQPSEPPLSVSTSLLDAMALPQSLRVHFPLPSPPSLHPGHNDTNLFLFYNFWRLFF